jgi:hypothetical protein
VTRDWKQWHRYYDFPDSSLVQRLETVRRHLRRALAEAPCDADGVVRVTTVCAGEGRDILPVLAERVGNRDMRAVLLENNPELARRARATIDELGLFGVEVRMEDAGRIGSYRDVPPAHVLMICGVFGNISINDVQCTIALLSMLLAPEGIVIWTRGIPDTGRDRSEDIRDTFAGNGFTELVFERTEAGDFRIGMNRLVDDPAGIRSASSDSRMFTFL